MWREEDKSNLDDLPQLNEAEIRFLWSFDWFDGPLHGLAEYRGRKVWFDFHHMDDEGTDYFYVLYPLTDRQIEEAEVWKQTRGQYESNTQTGEGKWVGRDESRHNADWNGPLVEGVPPLGWFMDGSNQDFYGIKIYPRSEDPDATA